MVENRCFNLAMGQMLVVGGDANGNIRRAAGMIRRAGEQGCALIVLPECLNLGWTHPSARESAPPIPGLHSAELCRAAQQAQIYVVAGLVERAEDRIYNAAILIAPDGAILLKHHKINELDIARHLYSTGESLAVARTPLGTIGIDICADNFPDSLVIGHTLARMGAEILLSPSAWAVEAEHDNAKDPYGGLWKESFRTLARLYDITVVGVSNVGWIEGGAWDGHKCIGCSLAVGPGGTILAEGPYGESAETLIIVPIEIIPRRSMSTPQIHP
jgi:predicted amidohydrolase